MDNRAQLTIDPRAPKNQYDEILLVFILHIFKPDYLVLFKYIFWVLK